MRCMNCRKFPGNGKPCPEEDEPRRKKVYAMDMACGNVVPVMVVAS